HKNLILAFLFSIAREVANFFLWIRNFVLWYFKEPVTRDQMAIFRDNVFSAFLTFLFFAYSFMMTTATEPWRCTYQANGKYTMDTS
ncbi:hypothetical protein, partial [Vibrio cholerae]|uniref:hypothetical protein n=1 Tax=Vibrio cholerae TaxID=666 RepID=UPI001F3BB1FC